MVTSQKMNYKAAMV